MTEHVISIHFARDCLRALSYRVVRRGPDSVIWRRSILHYFSSLQNRDAAQKELKQIRQDLMEKKINLTLTKSQRSLATLGNPENIAV